MLKPGKGLFGTERDQNEIANAQYPAVPVDEVLMTDLPAFHDIRRSNSNEEHVPAVMQNEKNLAGFLAQTMKMRRSVMQYEFGTVAEDEIQWATRAVPKEVYSKPFSDIANAMASLMWGAENAVGIRIALGEGVSVGTYKGDAEAVQYSPYIKVLHRVTNQ
tara:strand:- start:2025 stop:2507 length:483 start_codon:yes stop_codon:yes gene_type:complete